MATALKIKGNRRLMRIAVANAVAHQRFEGLQPSSAVIRDLDLVATGQMTFEVAAIRLKQRYLNVQVCG